MSYKTMVKLIVTGALFLMLVTLMMLAPICSATTVDFSRYGVQNKLLNIEKSAQSLDYQGIGHFTRIEAKPSVPHVIFASNSTTLYSSKDHGESWQKICSFDSPITSIYLKGSDTLFVGTLDGKIWKSDDFLTFDEVLEMDGGFSSVWSWGSYKNEVYVGEYGAPDDKHDFIWRSTNNGDNWVKVFNTTEQIGHSIKHIHLCSVDPFTGNVYLSTGDYKHNQSIFFSNNSGKKWYQISGEPWRWNYKSITAAPQPTSIVFTKDNIYFGSDKDYGMIYRYDKTSGEWGFFNVISHIQELKGGSGMFFDEVVQNNVTYFVTRGNNANNSQIIMMPYPEMDKLAKLIELPGYLYYDITTDGKYLYAAQQRWDDWKADNETIRIRLLSEKEAKSLFYSPSDTLNQSDKYKSLLVDGTTQHLFLHHPLTEVEVTLNPVKVTNLIDNPSFEVDSDSDGVPDNWRTNFPSGRRSLTPDAYIGESALKLEGNDTYYYLQSNPINVENDIYRFSFYYKYKSKETSELVQNQISVPILNLNKEGVNFTVVDFSRANPVWHSFDWRRAISEPVKVCDPNAAYMQATFKLEDYNQTFCIDAIQLQKDVGWATPYINGESVPSDISIRIRSDEGTKRITYEGELTSNYTTTLDKLSGLVDISADIGGSGAVKVIISEKGKVAETNKTPKTIQTEKVNKEKETPNFKAVLAIVGLVVGLLFYRRVR